jgi:hypothetical protein
MMSSALMPTSGLPAAGTVVVGDEVALKPSTSVGENVNVEVRRPEVGTASQGDTIEEALANLREATELYLEECPQPALAPRLLTTFEVNVA